MPDGRSGRAGKPNPSRPYALHSRSLPAGGDSAVDLASSYRICRDIHRAHGRSYYRATTLLPASRRPAVHALYAFTRVADDIVDCGDVPIETRAQRLAAWGAQLHDGLAGQPFTDRVLPAVVDTIGRYRLELSDIDIFMKSMTMDLTEDRYATYADLLSYMEGSSAVIGTLMLPVLGIAPGASTSQARYSARELGFAFQLTNFIRDVAEDLERGRVYLPVADLATFGVTPQQLADEAAQGSASPAVRALIAFECDRALAHYRAALPGISLLDKRSRVCIRAAFVLYGQILQEIASRGYDPLRGRAVVAHARRARLVAQACSSRGFAALTRRWSLA